MLSPRAVIPALPAIPVVAGTLIAPNAVGTEAIAVVGNAKDDALNPSEAPIPELAKPEYQPGTPPVAAL